MPLSCSKVGLAHFEVDELLDMGTVLLVAKRHIRNEGSYLCR